MAAHHWFWTGTPQFPLTTRRFRLDDLVSIGGPGVALRRTSPPTPDGPGAGSIAARVPDLMLGIACLATAVLLVIAAGRREIATRRAWPRLEAALGGLLFLCGAAQLARTLAVPPDRSALAPIMTGVACWAAAFTLRSNRRQIPAESTPATRTVTGPASPTALPEPEPDAPAATSAEESAPPARPRWGESRASGPRPAASPRPPGHRVLIVDDDGASAQIMEMILRLEGHEIQLAASAPAALEAIPLFRPNVILSDIGLPGIDGHELARRIRLDPELSAGLALLVAVTGYAGAEVQRRSREAGFDHHLVKPVDPETVLAMLASLEWRDPMARVPAGPATPADVTIAP